MLRTRRLGKHLNPGEAAALRTAKKKGRRGDESLDSLSSQARVPSITDSGLTWASKPFGHCSGGCKPVHSLGKAQVQPSEACFQVNLHLCELICQPGKWEATPPCRTREGRALSGHLATMYLFSLWFLQEG